MRVFLAFLLLTSLVAAAEAQFYANVFNKLSKEDLDAFFKDDSEAYLFVTFVGENCLNCRWQQFYPNLLTYAFENIPNMVFGTTNTTSNPRVAEICDVDPESSKLEIRMITPGGVKCVQYLDDENLQSFVSRFTDFRPHKSNVFFRSAPAFEELMKNKTVTHFVEFSNNMLTLSHDFAIEIEKVGEAFAMEPLIDFTRIECTMVPTVCEEYNVTSFPYFRLFVADLTTIPADAKLELATSDSLIAYLNQIMGTHRVMGGGLDHLYGRTPELDVLADQFVESTTEDEKKEIMKQLARDHNKYKNAATYYMIMKDVVANGQDIIQERINSTVIAISEITPQHEKYSSLTRRMNVLHQFEKFETTRSVILSPMNVDRLFNGKRHILALFYNLRCPECQAFTEVYKDAFQRHPLNVYFAAVNAVRYEPIRLRFNVTTHPLVKFFRAGEPEESAKIVKVETADELVEWLNNEIVEIAKDETDKRNAKLDAEKEDLAKQDL